MGNTKRWFLVVLYWLSVIFVVGMVLLAICTKYAEAAEPHAIVSFNDAEHLLENKGEITWH